MRCSYRLVWPCAFLVLAALACNAPFGLTTLPFLATATPTPTGTPTSSPAEWQARAAQAVHDGDYAAAAEIYRNLLSWSLDNETAVQTRMGLGTALLRDGDYAGAAAAFRDLLCSRRAPRRMTPTSCWPTRW